jgi:cytochrome c oxidase subunit III
MDSGHHNPALGHHFETMEQQHGANILGMWLFLATEIMLFGGLFAAYILFRMLYPDVFLESGEHQNVLLGAVNTAVLIGSSLTMALAVRSAQLGSKRPLLIFLAVTAALGAVFIGIKGIEYYEHYVEGLVPGIFWAPHDELDPRAQLFFFLYFVMTGIHALHIIIGITLILILLVRSRSGRYLGDSFLPIELMGLYWHFIDVVWVYLFPLLYLIGRHQAQ